MTMPAASPSRHHRHRLLATCTAAAIVLAMLAGGLAVSLWRGSVQPVGPATKSCLEAIDKAKLATQGKAGNTGQAGPTGGSGTPGRSGPAGVPGQQGPSGAQGAAGVCTKGDIGASAYETWLQEGHSGSEADFIAALRGEQGEPGATGAAGATGPRGDQGPTGATGATGATGPQGDQGATGATGATGPKGDPGTPGGVRYYGSFFDTSNQSNVTPGAPMAMRLNSTDISAGVTVVSGTQVTVANAGVYNLQFSAQLAQSVSPANNVSIWLRKNGVDVPWTNTEVTLQGNGARYVAAWNFFITMAAGDNVQLMWYSQSPGMGIISTPGNGQPGIPGLILTMQQA